MPLQVSWPPEVKVPAALEPLAQSVLAEALRNVPSTPTPTDVEVEVSRDADTFVLQVRQRRRSLSAAAARPGWGCGWPRSRHSARAGWWSSGPPARVGWRLRLVMPVEEAGRGR